MLFLNNPQRVPKVLIAYGLISILSLNAVAYARVQISTSFWAPVSSAPVHLGQRARLWLISTQPSIPSRGLIFFLQRFRRDGAVFGFFPGEVAIEG